MSTEKIAVPQEIDAEQFVIKILVNDENEPEMFREYLRLQTDEKYTAKQARKIIKKKLLR